MLTSLAYGGWSNCLQLANDQLELLVTTEVGPRVLRLAFREAANLFCEFPDQLGRTGGREWRAYGGHRFWHAPEVVPRTYWPDNVPVEHHWDGRTLTLVQPKEESTGLVKAIALTLDPERAHVRVEHRLMNRGLWAVEVAPWAITIMAPGGRAIVPQEPYRPHAEALLPARPMALWHYTDMSDPRWTWGKRYVQLRQDTGRESYQKVGMRNSLGWAAYVRGDEVFLKHAAFDPGATYPDFGCNTELFTNAEMLEVESLGPLAFIQPGGTVRHVEHWFLHRASVGPDEASIDGALLPLVGASVQAMAALDRQISNP